MREHRHALIRSAVAATATAAALVALPGTAGAAAVKPVCNLLVDAVDDTYPLDAPYADVRGGDVASGDVHVAGALRLVDLDAASFGGPAGARWDLSFVAGAARYTFGARVSALGVLQASFTRDGIPAGLPTVALNAMTNTITWTVPRASVTDLPAKPKGDPIGGLAAATFVGPADLAADAGTSDGTYADGAPSCLKVA
jgi:hypothetical protein